MTSIATSIETISNDGWSEEYVRSRRPVLIRNGMRDWPAMKWSPAHLRSVCGDQPITVQVSHSGKWLSQLDGSAPDPAAQYGIPNVPFGTAAEWILTRPHGYAYYVSQADVKQFPTLSDDLRFPERERPMTNVWFGSSGTVTPLHHDGLHNLFGQVYGTKTVVLFDPADTPYLSPRTEGSMSHLSPIDIESPDLALHPEFPRATPYTVFMEPGDLLFMPAYWWHHVRAHETSISVNQWWRAAFAETIGPGAMRHWLGIYKRDGWCQYRATNRLGRAELMQAAASVQQTAPELAIVALNVVIEDIIRWPGGQSSGLEDSTTKALRAALNDVREGRGHLVTPAQVGVFLIEISSMLESSSLA
jgi:jumonji domain-containing protein 7